MGKPRMLGKTSGFMPNSQADRRMVNRTFRHQEYQKKVQLKKKIELDAAIADLDKMVPYNTSTSWEELLEAMEALSSAAQEAAQESAEKIKEAYEMLSKAIKEE